MQLLRMSRVLQTKVFQSHINSSVEHGRTRSALQTGLCKFSQTQKYELKRRHILRYGLLKIQVPACSTSENRGCESMFLRAQWVTVSSEVSTGGHRSGGDG